MTSDSAATTAPASWKPYVPSAQMPWDQRRVVYLHRRASFAAPWPILERDLQSGPQAAIDRLFNAETSPEFESLYRTIAVAAVKSDNPTRLKAWWLSRMLFTTDPLRERLTLMWHNHFATSNRKVTNLLLMHEQNDLFRKNCCGPFGDLLTSVVKHPAMLNWLDANSNRKGKANENLSRELMELFTLGVGHYTEEDVKETARALTGWGTDRDRFEYFSSRHDDGEKRLLGHQGQWNGDDVLRILLDQPATARRLAWRITKAFLGNPVSEAAIEELAAGLRARQLDIRWAVETVIRSEQFFSEDQMGTHVVGPVEFVIGSLQALEVAQPAPDPMKLADWATRMGQDLFYPPNVGGWKEGPGWLTSSMIIARANFAAALVNGSLHNPVRASSLAELSRKYGAKNGLEESVSWLARLLWGTVDPAMIDNVIQAARGSKASDPLSTAIALLLSSPQNLQS